MTSESDVKRSVQSDRPHRAGSFDEQAAYAAYVVAESLRQEMLDNFLKTQERIDRIPTEEQREQLQRAWGGH